MIAYVQSSVQSKPGAVALASAIMDGTNGAFGSSRVSFAPLAGLTLDFLRIDDVIIQNILTGPDNPAKVRASASAARKMGMHTIAEFVESDDALAKLREAGVDYAQGFGIGRPGPIAQVS